MLHFKGNCIIKMKVLEQHIGESSAFRRTLWLMQSIGMSYDWSLENSLQKIKVLTQKMRKLQTFPAKLRQTSQSLWLREEMYMIKRDLLGFFGPLETLEKNGMQKNQGPISKDKKEKVRWLLWLIEVMYAIKRNLFQGSWDHRKVACKKIKDRNLEIRKFSALKPFQDRHAKTKTLNQDIIKI